MVMCLPRRREFALCFTMSQSAPQHTGNSESLTEEETFSNSEDLEKYVESSVKDEEELEVSFISFSRRLHKIYYCQIPRLCFKRRTLTMSKWPPMLQITSMSPFLPSPAQVRDASHIPQHHHHDLNASFLLQVLLSRGCHPHKTR